MRAKKKFDECKVYTPLPIAKYMIKKLNIDFSSDFKVLEPAVGTGFIFVQLIKEFLKCESNNGVKYQKLNSSFIAFDIDDIALNILRIELDKTLSEFELDHNKVEWKIFNYDLLDKPIPPIFEGVTHIICNPPYIAYKYLSSVQKTKIKQFTSCEKYSPNLYFAFIEYMITAFSCINRVVIISPSAFFKGKSSEDLRKLIVSKVHVEEIIDFTDHVFDEQVLVAITTYSKDKVDFSYNTSCKDFDSIDHKFVKEAIDNQNFTRKLLTDYSDYIRFQDLFDIRGSIATLNDKFYLIRHSEIVSSDCDNIIFNKEVENEKSENIIVEYTVEKPLVKELFISPKKSKNKSYIVFPYNNAGIGIDFLESEEQYPHYFNYFNKMVKKNPESHFFGRSQNLSKVLDEKLVIPKSINGFYFFKSANQVVNSGIVLFLKNEYMQFKEKIYKILNDSGDFIFEYLKVECIPNDSSYYSLTTTILKKTPIIEKEVFYGKINLYD